MNGCLELLEQLVAIPSESQNEEAMARFLADYLRRELGMEVQLQHVEGKSFNVRGLWPREARRRLILGGHIDTVPPSERWAQDPYQLTVQGDIIRGLGAGDMKGGLAAQLTVLRRLRQEGRSLDCELEFLGVADEERHSIGANAYVQARQQEPSRDREEFFLMAEPHYDNIVIGATGKVLFRVDIQGTGGHASTPEKGVNAIDCMAEFLAQINHKYRALYQQGRCASHCCLRVESAYSGYSLNIPEHCFCLLNKQLAPQESAGQFAEDLEGLYQQMVGQGTVSITQQIPSYPSYCLPEDQKDLAALVRFLEEKHQHRPELRVNQSVSDGNILYNRLKIPTVLYGPQGVDFHTEREHLLRSTLESYMDQLYGYLLDVYGGGGAD